MSEQAIEAGFGEGYWSDHWDYNLDLVENYLMIYPEHKEELLFAEKDYRFYDSPAFVQPRSLSYVLTKNGVRQYQVVIKDEKKLSSPTYHKNQTNWLRNQDGSVATTTLFGKMMILACNKFSILDPYGMGISMDGGKPGWNDAMNGLPGLIGSSMAETCELSRQLVFLLNALKETNLEELKVSLPSEVAEFMNSLEETIVLQKETGLSEFAYWDKQSCAKEAYREKVRYGLSGEETVVDGVKINHFVELMQEKVMSGIEKAIALGDGIMPTYFTYDATAFELRLDEAGNEIKSPSGYPYVNVSEFKQQVLPYFLEGPARSLTIVSKDQAKKMCEKLKASDVYDKKLKMYKTSESIENISYENGRIRAFTPGWLERESIFLHMEYKYFLSMLEAGLWEEYYEAMEDALIPFLAPEMYGRSILENSSFLASSVNPNPEIQGRGYVARLSGSTVELLSMWIHMFCGKTLFTVQDGQLQFALHPALPADFFDANGEVQFTLMSKCNVTYHNTTKKATFGNNGAQQCKMTYRMNGKEYVAENCVITGEAAVALRNGSVEQIDVYYQ